MFDLVIQSGKQQGKRLTLPPDKVFIVGREEGCQLLLNSALVSRQHCHLKQADDGIWVRDLNSQNGTYVNEVAITEPTLMTAGDTVRIGATVFEVQPHAKPGSGPTKAAAPKPKKEGALSDADIASWLSEGEPPSGKSPGDTAIIHGDRGGAPSRSAPPTTSAPTPSVAVPTMENANEPHRKFRSIKEEAADIIRRHWSKVRGEAANKP